MRNECKIKISIGYRNLELTSDFKLNDNEKDKIIIAMKDILNKRQYSLDKQFNNPIEQLNDILNTREE